MTFAFGSFTVGAALLFSAFMDMSMIDLILGRPGKSIASQGESDPNQSSSLMTSNGGNGGGSIPPTVNSPSSNAKGVGSFDGHQVANWIIPWLKKSRAAGWKGRVTSGYRTPQYSEQLCRQMCGQPSCPGTCGGRTSNHSGKAFPDGAVDVSDEARFARIQKQIGSPLRNDLPADRVHFSVSGH